MDTATATELWNTALVRIRNGLCATTDHQRSGSTVVFTRCENDAPHNGGPCCDTISLRQCLDCQLWWRVDEDNDIVVMVRDHVGHCIAEPLAQETFVTKATLATLPISPALASMAGLSNHLVEHCGSECDQHPSPFVAITALAQRHNELT